MIGPGTGIRVYLACGHTDMRKGIAGLSAIAQDVLRQRPSSGAVFACTTRFSRKGVSRGLRRRMEVSG